MKKIYIYVVVILIGASAIFINYLNNKSKPDANEKVIIQNSSENANEKIENKGKRIKEKEDAALEENKKFVDEINRAQNVSSEDVKKIDSEAKQRMDHFLSDTHRYTKPDPNADFHYLDDK